MEEPSLEAVEYGIVLRGAFNPHIFHPQWMARKEIISEGEASGAAVKISHKEVSEFDLEYCTIQVLQERFYIYSKQEPYFKTLKDLTLSIFNILGETPIYQLGINYTWHYKFKNKDDFHSFGHRHAPKEPLWDKILESPGLSQLNIQGRRNDQYDGVITVSTGVSGLIPVDKLGVSVSINDHYDLGLEKDMLEMDAQLAMGVLENNLENSKKNADKINEEIIKYGSQSAN